MIAGALLVSPFFGSQELGFQAIQLLLLAELLHRFQGQQGTDLRGLCCVLANVQPVCRQEHTEGVRGHVHDAVTTHQREQQVHSRAAAAQQAAAAKLASHAATGPVNRVVKDLDLGHMSTFKEDRMRYFYTKIL